jgi:hypothetical protein
MLFKVLSYPNPDPKQNLSTVHHFRKADPLSLMSRVFALWTRNGTTQSKTPNSA